MAHFYGVLKGSRGEATRCGTTASGETAIAASWHGAGEARMTHNSETDSDRLTLHTLDWQGAGKTIKCYDGPAGGAFDVHAIKAGEKVWHEVASEVTEEDAYRIALSFKTPTAIVPAGSYFHGYV